MRGSTQCSTTRACSAHISQRSFLSSFLELKETKWATSHTSLAGQKMQSGAGTFLRIEALKEPWHRSVVP